MNKIKPTNLLAGNRALRQKDFARSVQCYMQALLEQSGLERTVLTNLAYARLKYLQQGSKSGRAYNVTIITNCPETTPSISRVRYLTALLNGVNKISSGQIAILSTQHNSLLAASDGVNVVNLAHVCPSSIPDETLLQVAKNPAERVFVCNPCEATVALGIAYKLVWGAQLIVDLSGNQDISYSLPKLAYDFDLITTPDSDLRLHFGGYLLNNATDLNGLPAQTFENQFIPQSLIDFSRSQGGLWANLSLIANSVTARNLIKASGLFFDRSFADSVRELLARLGFSNALTRHEDISSLCAYQKDTDYLIQLYRLTVGRVPFPHESAHFNEQLATGEISRIQLAELILTADEGRRHMTNLARVELGKQTSLPYRLPRRGEIQPESIAFLEHDAPIVSILIPVYGKVEYTLACLKSIADNLPKTSFEVLVLDDRSPDDSVQLLQKIRNLKVIVNPQNLGFLRSCNHGAVQAQGKYFYLLNNDTQVTAGWLDALIETFEHFPNTGLVGSKLIFPDGRLQEAGGIIWQDGSAWNFGRFQDPLLPVYNYAREVDYCSGASIMLTAALFNELGGFDEHYAPAYAEDSDLALKVRDRGYRVIYQPMSAVIHYEGVTSGTDTTQGVKAYQIENAQKLYQRWRNRFETHQAPGTDVDRAKDRRAIRRVLVLDHCTPTPDQDAGSVTVFNLLLLLREMDFQVTFIPEDNFLYLPTYTAALQRNGIEVLYAPYFTSVEQHLKESGMRYDLAFLFRPGNVERHLEKIREYCGNAKVLYHTVDLHFLRMQREAELLNDQLKLTEANAMRRREMDAIRAADASIVHSTVELEMLRLHLPDVKLHVFPLIIDACGTKTGFSERRDVVFIGGYQHTPNVDAVKYMVSEIMPLLRHRIPGVRFYAVGSRPPQEIQELACDDVIVTGYVENLTPLLDKMRVSVAPLRYGAGIKGKIGSAMAVGLPVVATSLAAEGMSLSPGENILVADDPEAIAQAVALLYSNEYSWHKLSKAGLDFADRVWGAEAAWKILNTILTDIGLPAKRGNFALKLYKEEMPSTENDVKISTVESPRANVDVNSIYLNKIQQELSIFEKQVDVHNLPNIFHYWSNKHLKPIFDEAGIRSIEEFFGKNMLEAKRRTGNSSARFLSIGSGNCDLEVNIVKYIKSQGCDSFVLECIEINPSMLERGRILASENGVAAYINFTIADFNTWVPTERYDAVMANQSLHHVSNLEHLYDQVKQCLFGKGSFVISDMIGRNGHLRWPESLAIVQNFWQELQYAYKFNHLLNRHEEVYENWDCSKEGFEGIRAQEVLPLLLERFENEMFVGYSNVIDIFVDRAFGHNFNSESKSDRELIDRIHTEDELSICNGKLTPTHMFGVFVKERVISPYYSRGISPLMSIRRPENLLV